MKDRIDRMEDRTERLGRFIEEQLGVPQGMTSLETALCKALSRIDELTRHYTTPTETAVFDIAQTALIRAGLTAGRKESFEDR